MKNCTKFSLFLCVLFFNLHSKFEYFETEMLKLGFYLKAYCIIRISL